MTNINKTILILALTGALFFSGFSSAKELKNLDHVKQELIQYHDSGEYHKDQQKVIDDACSYLKKRLQQPTHKKLAIVLDIDETSLSNYPDMVKMSFGGTLKEIEDLEGEGRGPAILPTLKLYRFAKKNNVAVFFVTARKEQYQEGTIRNLKAVGYDDWDGLILKSEKHQGSSAPYKIAARKQIKDQGYDIVLNIGDQESDIIGGHAEKMLKMPNPFYIVP